MTEAVWCDDELIPIMFTRVGHKYALTRGTSPDYGMFYIADMPNAPVVGYVRFRPDHPDKKNIPYDIRISPNDNWVSTDFYWVGTALTQLILLRKENNLGIADGV